MPLFAALLLVMNALEYSSSERFNIVPSPDSPCPGEFTGEPCLTLEQYVSNPSLSSIITLEIHPGNHSLDSELRVLRINSFTMRATSSATVTCRQQLSQPFYFSQLQQLHISGITFVGCRMELGSIRNATFERNSFVNRTSCCPNGAALYAWSSSVLIRQCIVLNNRVYSGAIYGSHSTFVVEQTAFRSNYYAYSCCRNTYGGAIYLSGGYLNVLNSNFSDNSIASYGGNGGAIYFDGNNITVTNSTFINNTAITGGGGAIYSARRYTSILLINNSFVHNIAAHCGAMEVDEFYHHHVNITGNTFIYNRAVGQVSGNNGGGVICIRNASISLLDNDFSHNSAAGEGGVIQVDESDITIERSIFRNNSAVRNGGVLHTYFYPTRYTIINSSFTDNQAGDNGGVMYVGRAGSHVTISQSTFGFNNATERGGVITIIGSTLEINSGSIFENNAEMGEMVSACNSIVTIFNVGFQVIQDPTYSFCSLYDQGTTIMTPGIEENTTSEPTTTAAGTEDIINIVPSTGSPCPGEFTGDPCFTLEQYTTYPPSQRTSNIVFNLHPGIHHLNSQVSLSNIHSLRMQANVTTTVTVLCREVLSYYSFAFSQLQLMYISGITFIGCSMYLDSANATIVKSSFINRTSTGFALSIFSSFVQIKQCTISNNSNGAISFTDRYNSISLLTIDQSIFENNSYIYSYIGNTYYYFDSEAIQMRIYGSFNYYGSINYYGSANYHGGSIGVSITNSIFKDNDGIGIRVYSGQKISILNSTFEDNRAGYNTHGGAITFYGDRITIFNNNFTNNTASSRGGGAIYFASDYRTSRHNATRLLMNNTFSHNTAAYCGVIKLTESHHSYINITRNTFTYNRAIDLVPGNNGGGVICARNASVFILDNNFSHNSAAGDAGVIQADESEVTIRRSIFSNNTAGGNGGALQTYLYPTNYTIINSSFTDNQVGGDGGVMYVGRGGSHVTIYESTFSNNYAAERGGVIAIVGSTLQLNRASVYENFARTGEVINSCNSNVTIINPIVLATQEPIVSSLCALYNNSNAVVSPMTVSTPVPTTEPLTQESTTTEDITTKDDTTEEGITITTTTVPQPNYTTEDITVMTTTFPQPDDTTADSITTATTTSHQSDDVASTTEDTPHSTESDSSTNVETVTTTTSLVDDQDNQQDTIQHSLHTTVPGYVAIGAFVVLFVLFALFGAIILVKMIRVKPPEPQNMNRLNSSAYEYPTMKNEYTLPEVHLVST